MVILHAASGEISTYGPYLGVDSDGIMVAFPVSWSKTDFYFFAHPRSNVSPVISPCHLRRHPEKGWLMESILFLLLSQHCSSYLEIWGIWLQNMYSGTDPCHICDSKYSLVGAVNLELSKMHCIRADIQEGIGSNLRVRSWGNESKSASSCRPCCDQISLFICCAQMLWIGKSICAICRRCQLNTESFGLAQISRDLLVSIRGFLTLGMSASTNPYNLHFRLFQLQWILDKTLLLEKT